MLTLDKDTQVNFKTDSHLLDKAKRVFAQHDLDLTGGFNLFLQNVVIQNDVPLLSEEELEREILFNNLQKEMEKAIIEFENGNGIPLEKVRSDLGL